MNNLLSIGGLELLFWLFSKNKGKCARCNYPLREKDNPRECPNCGQLINWKSFKNDTQTNKNKQDQLY